MKNSNIMKASKNEKLLHKAIVKLAKYNNEIISENKSQMYCPFCGEPLQVGESKRVQSLEEHVCDPNSEPTMKQMYYCMHEACWVGKYFMWMTDGSSCYTDKYYNNLKTLSEQEYNILDKKYTSAINSFACKMDTEIYKIGLRNEFYLPKWLTLNQIQLFIEFKYKSNDFGDVLKTNYYLGFIKTDSNGDLCILGTWFYVTWNYLYINFKRHLMNVKDVETTGDVYKAIKAYKQLFEPSRNRQWKYRAFEWAMKKLYCRTYKKYQNLMYAEKFLDTREI